jgi:hypothetical protein
MIGGIAYLALALAFHPVVIAIPVFGSLVHLACGL